MTKCYQQSQLLSPLKRRKIEVAFDGGDITSDGGALLLREVDQRIGLTQSIDRVIPDPRRSGACRHSQLELVRQRIYALALGYEDLNDHLALRHDGAVQTAVGRLDPLASASTICRLEQRVERDSAVDLHRVLLEQFISSFKSAPKRLVLDFDATHDLVHGNQEGRHFNGFYDGYCFLPLYVFCNSQLLTCYLRPSSRGAAHHAAAILKLLTRGLRRVWPKVKIVIRADAGFCNPLLLNWCDRNRVEYIIGMSKNSVLTRNASPLINLAEAQFEVFEKPQRLFDDFEYRAGSWSRARRMLVKAEHTALGENTRYVVTSLKGSPRWLYQGVYCVRGDMENRIKEQKCLFSDRTSCHHWWPNQFRVLLSGFAYVLIDTLRRTALHGKRLAKAQVDTIQLKLLKIGAVVLRNTRRIRIHLSSHLVYREEFEAACAQLMNPG